MDPDAPVPPAAADGPSERELRELMAATRQAVAALLRGRGVHPNDSEDVVQEALVVVVRRWAEIADPASFLLGTLKKRIQTHFRALRKGRGRHVQVDADELERVAGAAPSPQRQVDCREDARKLLALLPERAGRIVAMRYAEELSPREIAQAQGGSESGVRKSAHRGLGRLRRYLKTAGER